jgi:hypothetical protein
MSLEGVAFLFWLVLHHHLIVRTLVRACILLESICGGRKIAEWQLENTVLKFGH